MSWFRRTFGLDGVDLAIQGGVTVALMFLGSQFVSHGAAVAMMAAVTGGSLAILGIRRGAALKRLPAPQGDEIAAERLGELEARVTDMEQAQYRLQELEERVDFAERLLAQSREPERLS